MERDDVHEMAVDGWKKMKAGSGGKLGNEANGLDGRMRERSARNVLSGGSSIYPPSFIGAPTLVLPWNMVDNSSRPLQTHFGPVFVMRQFTEVFSSWSQAPSECFCEHLHPSPRDMTLHPPLTSLPLKRKPLATGKRAPRAPSIVEWFCRMPWLGYAAGSVAPPACHLVLAAARASPAVIHEDATSVVIDSPPFQVGQEVWGGLRRGPGATS